MKDLPFIRALIYSIIILSLAIFIDTQDSEVETLSYGWVEALIVNHYFLYNGVCCLLVLLSGYVLSRICITEKLIYHTKSYLPLLLYSSVMIMAVGHSFLYISAVTFFLVVSLRIIISRSHHAEESISGAIFKLVLLIFLLMFLHPAMILLIIPLLAVIIHFRDSAMDYGALFGSFVYFALISLWVIWYFDLDYREMYDLTILRSPFNEPVIIDYISSGMLVLLCVKRIMFGKIMESMDNMACKVVQYSFVFAFVVCLVIPFINAGREVLAVYAIPTALIIFFNMASLTSVKTRRLLMTLFYLVVIVLFGLFLDKSFNFPLDYIESLYR